MVNGRKRRPVDGADAITLAAYDGSASERQLRVLCGSPAERDAWLAAIREAREVSLHRLYTLQQSRFAAEEARDTFRRERDASRREAERLHEEIAVYKAARERAQEHMRAAGLDAVVWWGEWGHLSRQAVMTKTMHCTSLNVESAASRDSTLGLS